MSWTPGSKAPQAAQSLYILYICNAFSTLPVFSQSSDPAFADDDDGLFAFCATAIWCNCEAACLLLPCC